MDFSLTPEQVAYRDAVQRFAEERLDDDLTTRDAEHTFSSSAWKQCGELGIQGLIVPEEYGGQAADPLTTVLALEALGYGCRDNGLLFSLNAHLWSCVLPIVRFGTDEQKQRYLPGLADGSLVGVQAMTEPGSGSDAFSLSTTARLVGNHYELDGTKTLISNAPVADVFIVFATTDRAAGSAGLIALIVDRDTPGLEVGLPFRKMGLRTSPMSEVHLAGCRVPVDRRLGADGAGMAVFSTSMDWERSFILACAVGTMRRQLEQAVAYATTRTQFGQPIGAFQAVAHRLVDMRVRLDAARLLLYQLASLKAQGRRTPMESAIVKLFISDALVQSSLAAMETYGGAGYLEGSPAEREVRDALASRIYSGTSDIQRNIVARGLGLP